MSDSLRRLYNAIDSLFDRGALARDLRFSRAAGGSREPVTARAAFDSVRPAVRQLDRDARLKMIVSQNGIGPGGASPHWEFFFDLPQRRAQLVCEWRLPWDEAADGYGPAQIEIVAKPFPPENSPIRQLVKDGKLLHRQMIGMWQQELKRRPNLPQKFRDTDAVLADLRRQGLEPDQADFSLSTGLSPDGRLNWVAQTKNAAYYSALT